MLGEKELRVLEQLDQPKARQELVADLSYAQGTVTNALNRLEKHGLVDRERRNRETIVYPTEARCHELLQSLSATHPHVDFPALLTSSMLAMLYYLDAEEPVTAHTLTVKSGYSRATIFRNLRTLTNRAMMVKDRSRYQLTDEFEDLQRFATELYHHLHRNRVQRDIGSGTIVWESHDEFLVRTDEPVVKSDYHQTGLEAFSEYGLEFFTTSEHYYFYSQDRESLSPAELACHLLLIDDDARYRKYVLLLLAATQVSADEVESVAAQYGLQETFNSFLAYLRTKGDEQSPSTPPWEEIQSLANQYGIEI